MGTGAGIQSNGPGHGVWAGTVTPLRLVGLGTGPLAAVGPARTKVSASTATRPAAIARAFPVRVRTFVSDCRFMGTPFVLLQIAIDTDDNGDAFPAWMVPAERAQPGRG